MSIVPLKSVSFSKEAYQTIWLALISSTVHSSSYISFLPSIFCNRNSPSKFLIGTEKVLHPFDADGMISAITFNHGQAFFRNRFVRTQEFLHERKENKIIYRLPFVTQPSGGFFRNLFNLNLKNMANTNIIHFANKLLALMEGGAPYELSADSLDTIGVHSFDGLLQAKETFTAHPKIDFSTGNLLAFNYLYNPFKSSTTLTIFELDKLGRSISKQSVEVDGFTLFHDFAVTKNHVLFVQTPSTLNALPFLLGIKAPAQCVTFDSKLPAKLHVIGRHSNKSVATDSNTENPHHHIIELEPLFLFHTSNAFERENGDIVLDVAKSAGMELGTDTTPGRPMWETLDFDSVPVSTLTRYTIVNSESKVIADSTVNKAEEEVKKTAWKKQELFPFYFEFPVINPRNIGEAYQHVFGVSSLKKTGAGPFQRLVKVSMKSVDSDDVSEIQEWALQPEEFLGEAVFAPHFTDSANSAEDDGYLLVMTLNTFLMKSYLLIFDAKDIAQGPTHRLELPTFVPHGLHGSYAPGVVFDFDDVQRKFRQYSVVDSTL